MVPILEQCADPPGSSPGKIEFGSGYVRWDLDRIEISLPAGGIESQLDSNRPGHLQLSRCVSVMPQGLLRREEATHCLHLVLRDGHTRLVLLAPVEDPDVLEGLPRVEPTGEQTELKPLLELAFAGLHLGTALAQMPTRGVDGGPKPAAETPTQRQQRRRDEKKKQKEEKRRQKDEARKQKEARKQAAKLAKSRPREAQGDKGSWWQRNSGVLLGPSVALLLIVTMVGFAVYMMRVSSQGVEEAQAKREAWCEDTVAGTVDWSTVTRVGNRDVLVLLERFEAQSYCYRLTALDPETGEISRRRSLGYGKARWVFGHTSRVLWLVDQEIGLMALDLASFQVTASIADTLRKRPALSDKILDNLNEELAHLDQTTGEMVMDTADGYHMRLSPVGSVTLVNEIRVPPEPGPPVCNAWERYATYMPDGRWIGLTSRARGSLRISTEPIPHLRLAERESQTRAVDEFEHGIDSSLVGPEPTFLNGTVFTDCDFGPLRLEDPLRVLVWHRTSLKKDTELELSLVDMETGTLWTRKIDWSAGPVSMTRRIGNVLVVVRGNAYIDKYRGEILGIDLQTGETAWRH